MSSLRTLRSFLGPLPSAAKTTRQFSTTPLNKLARMTIIGRLADAPEQIPTSTGRDMIRYALATSSGPKDNRSTNWWKVAMFAPGEEREGLRNAVLSLGKGSLVYVEGEATMNKFTDKDGKPQSSLNIVQRHIDILEKRESEELEG